MAVLALVDVLIKRPMLFFASNVDGERYHFEGSKIENLPKADLSMFTVEPVDRHAVANLQGKPFEVVGELVDVEQKQNNHPAAELIVPPGVEAM